MTMTIEQKAQAASTALMVLIALASSLSLAFAVMALLTFPVTVGFYLATWYPKVLDRILKK